MRSHLNIFNNSFGSSTTTLNPPQPPPRRRANSMGNHRQQQQQQRNRQSSVVQLPRSSLFDTTSNVSFIIFHTALIIFTYT